MTADARRFLNYEFATLSLVAGLATRNPQAPVYRNGAAEADKQRTKDWLRERLKRLAEQYHAGIVSEVNHIDNIATFADDATQELGRFLFHGKLRFGVAQKIVNLYLKYLWASDYITEPPHCPIDGRVAQKSNLRYQWTTSDSQAQYEGAIATLGAGPAGNCIAAWELREFEIGRQ